MSNPLIDITDFSFTIGTKTILDSISLMILEGEYLSVIGPNGAGKTTLLKCLMRIYSGGHGTITIKGIPLDRYSQKELALLMSFVSQSDGRALPFTVEEFVMMGRYPHLSPFTSISSEDKQKVHSALELTDTSHLAERSLNTLSAGECQTVFIAAALAQEPRILLLDEPTTFLDPKHTSDIHSIIKRINGEFGITIISVTHDINSAALQSDRIAILKDGRVAFYGNAVEVMDNNILERIYDRPFTFIPHPVTGQLIIVPEVSDS